MDDKELLERFEKQDKKLDQIWKSIERMRRAAMWRLIITVLVIVLPLIGISLALPKFLESIDLNRLGL